MRLRFITATPMSVTAGSGTYTGISTLMNALQRMGIEVGLATPTLHLPVYTAQRLLFNRRLRPDSSDVAVGFDMDGYTLAGGAMPHIASIKGVIADELRFEAGATRWTMSIQARYERAHIRRAGMVLTTSRYSAGRIVEFYGQPRRLEILPEAIDLDSWNRALASARVVPAPDQCRVLSVGRFYPRKRTHLLLEAAARLRDRMPNLQVRLVGDGPERERLRALHARLRLGDRVTFLGNVEPGQLAEEFRSCDIFCHPSLQEGFGIVFLEAMAAGKAIVAARASASPEVVPHALFAEPDSADSVAAALEALASDPARRRRMGEQGLGIVARYDAGAIAKSFLALARDLASRRERATAAY